MPSDCLALFRSRSVFAARAFVSHLSRAQIRTPQNNFRNAQRIFSSPIQVTIRQPAGASQNAVNPAESQPSACSPFAARTGIDPTHLFAFARAKPLQRPITEGPIVESPATHLVRSQRSKSAGDDEDLNKRHGPARLPKLPEGVSGTYIGAVRFRQ